MNRKQNHRLCSGRKPERRNRVEKFTEPLEILIYSNGLPLPEDLRDAIRVKIGRVRQYDPTAFRARVRLHKLRSQYRAHVLYEVRGNDVAAEHVADHPLTALDFVAEKIERRLRKRKTAQLARRARSARPAAVLTQPVFR